MRGIVIIFFVSAGQQITSWHEGLMKLLIVEILSAYNSLPLSPSSSTLSPLNWSVILVKLYGGTCNEDYAGVISREALHLLVCSIPPSLQFFLFPHYVLPLFHPLHPLLRLFFLQASHSLFLSPAPSVLLLLVCHSVSPSNLLFVFIYLILLRHCRPATKIHFLPRKPVNCFGSFFYFWANHILEKICSCCLLSGQMWTWLALSFSQQLNLSG